ncbi:zinc finger protein 808-like [Anoplophora glabripennis]|uniref:zinc finger protein 808-like n=1 Tax=Anoplophora glabripennis TaxID=217634 RepID=UPI000873C017|nr:zinc finger protein 808-like [Anoplophora glabripennis]
MDDSNLKTEQDSKIEALLEKPFIKEERDIPDYVDIKSFSDISLKLKPRDIPKLFRCNQCSNKYRKLEYLDIHSTVHDDNMTCPLCDQLFSCRKELREHINYHIKHKINDDKKVVYNCSYCLKSFNTRKQHTIHLRVHTNERPHKCEVCGEGFKQLGALKDHRVTHTKERKYVCEICNGAYTTSSSLKRHKRRMHDRGRTLDCTLCNDKFHNKADFNAHRIGAHPYTIFKKNCPFCFTVFYNKLAYSIHKQLHIDHLPRKKKLFMSYICNLCGEETNSLRFFMEHRRWHLSYTEQELREAAKLKSFQCKFCPALYKSKQTLFSHMDQHGETTVRCNLCQEFSTYLGLKAHKRRMHQLLECRMCLKVIIGRSKMYYHYKIHHANANLNKNHQCNICGKKYLMKTVLKYHYRHRHEINVKNFKCRVCGKRFLTQYAITTHKKKVHNLGVKLKCSKCDVILQTLKEVNEHKSTHVNEKSKMPKPFKCRVCKKIFQCRKNYKTHVSLKVCVNLFVKQRRLHACELCEKVFLKENHLRKHLDLHSGYKYKCQFCSETSKIIKTIQRHVKVHHPNKKVYWCEFCGEAFDIQSKYETHSSLHTTKIERGENVVKGRNCSDVKCEIKMELMKN